jgi:RNA polymerase sigma-70 factor (ECF subfamily)
MHLPRCAWRETNSMRVSRQDLVEALERTARGDLAAFKMVYAATSVKLYGIIIRILERSDLADEVLQEVYIRVWQRAGDFDRASSSPITWLATIARNRALDEARRTTMRSLDDYPELLQVPSEDDPAASLERNEDVRRLYACLDGLEPEKKEIVLLVYYHGMTREEISSRIKRPVATVKTWLRRSLAQLKDCLGQ